MSHSSLLLLAYLAAGQPGQMIWLPARVDAWTWSSPAGRYKLQVIPSTTDGHGRGLYRYRKYGKLLWIKALPYTLADVAIDDQGRIAGYTASAIDLDRTFETALLSPSGKVLMHEAHKLGYATDVEDKPRPRGDEVFFQPSRHRVVFHVKTLERDHNKSEHWWTYSFVGKRLPSLSRAPSGHAPQLSVYSPPKPQILTIHPPQVRLHLDRSWVIPFAGGLSDSFRDLRAFDFLGSDRIVGLKQVFRPGLPVGGVSVMVANLDGHVEKQIPLESTSAMTPSMTHTSGSTYVVAACSENPPFHTKLWSFDAGKGVLRSLGTVDGYSARQVAGFADGRFVLEDLSDVRVFDANGKFLRKIGRDLGGGWLSVPEDPKLSFGVYVVAVDRDQHILLSGGEGMVWFDEGGKFLRSLKTPQLDLNGRYRFMSSGAVMSVDFRSISRVDLGSGKSKRLDLRTSSGQTLEGLTDLRGDSQDRMWVSNGNGIYPVDDAGRIGDPLGLVRSANAPSSSVDLVLRQDGRVVVTDPETGRVFVYGPDGSLAAVTKPLPGDFTKTPPDIGFTEAPANGEIFLGLNPYESTPFLRFAADGSRVGKVSVPLDTVDDAGEVFDGKVSISGDRSSWWWCGRSLVAGGGKVLRTVSRWPDLSWLEGTEFSVAPNGDLMTVGAAWQGDKYGVQDPDRIGFFSATGEALSMAALPKGLGEVHWYQCAYDGRLSYIYSHGLVFAFDKSGKALWSFKPPHEVRQLFFNQGCLALFYGKTIEWYTVAQAGD